MMDLEYEKKIQPDCEIISVFNYGGYQCLIKQMPMGQYCGYVDLPKSSRFYGEDYDDIPIEVHGGITFGAAIGGYYRIGFDCAHAEDYIPGMADLSGLTAEGHHWTPAEVKDEIKAMVDQLIEAEVRR